MATDELRSGWEHTRALLERARADLTSADDERLGLYLEFSAHNELGLALDELVAVAEGQRAPRLTWARLAEAASSMGLTPDDAVHGASVRSIRDHLHAAQEWRQIRDLLNAWDPIGIHDSVTDFPKDEYDCLYAPLVSRLDQGASVDELTDFLRAELSDHFGLDPEPSRPDEFAAVLVRWHTQLRNL